MAAVVEKDPQRDLSQYCDLITYRVLISSAC